jgi:hypothetical protein
MDKKISFKDLGASLLWGLMLLITLLMILFFSIAIFGSFSGQNRVSKDQLLRLSHQMHTVVDSVSVNYPEIYDQYGLLGYLNRQDSQKEVEHEKREVYSKTNERLKELAAKVFRLNIDYKNQYGFEYDNVRDKLQEVDEYIINENKVSNYNSSYTLSAFFSFVLVLGCFYYMYRLIRYKRYGFRGNASLLLVVMPILPISLYFVFSVRNISGIANTSQWEGWNYIIIASIIYPFVVYPMLFIMAKSKGGVKSYLFGKK